MSSTAEKQVVTQADQVPAAQGGESAAIIAVIERAAMNPEVDIDKMERLLQMQERIHERNAEMEFNAAMADMQDAMPSVVERASGHNIKYASFEDINDVAKPIMQRYGFAVSFRVKNVQGGLEVTGVLMHRGGHREETTMTLPLDNSGSKNAVQAVGSSTSYGKRYVMCALLNITTRGEDDDGVAAVSANHYISEQQAESLIEAARLAGVDERYICEKAKTRTVYEISASRFAAAFNHLRALEKKAEGSK